MTVIHIPTFYGDVVVDDPLLIELIQSPAFQRLKGINQYGVVPMIFPTEAYSRYDHSLGVFYLLQKAKSSKEELIAGLLHDVSHTVFSHVGDYVYKSGCLKNSYQDDIHLWHLQESGVDKILAKYNLNLDQINHKQPSFLALDQPLPHLCADRLEYNLQGGVLRGILSSKDLEEITGTLIFKEGRWMLTELEPALKLARSSLIMTETLWGAPWEALLYRWAADALKRAFDIDLITFQEFHFSTDEFIWNKLSQSDDKMIVELLKRMQNIHSVFNLCPLGKEDLLLSVKFRGLDPLVQMQKEAQPLTHLDSAYATEYKNMSAKMASGWPIKIL